MGPCSWSRQWWYLAGALILSGHHGTSLPDGHLKVLQDRGKCWIGSASPLQSLLNASLQRCKLLLRTPANKPHRILIFWFIKLCFLEKLLYHRHGIWKKTTTDKPISKSLVKRGQSYSGIRGHDTPFRFDFCRDTFIIQQDNEPKHNSTLCKNY